MTATDSEGPLWHPVPRLDAPDRIWLLPSAQAKWLGAGVFSGPVAAQLLAFFGGLGVDAWGLWQVWAIWLVGLVLGAVGAFWRPGGLHVGQWVSIRLDFALLPRRAVWKPVGKGPLWW